MQHKFSLAFVARLSADGCTISMHELIKRTIVASAFGLTIVGSAGAASVAAVSEASPMVFYRTVIAP
jgi:hypothetical protein